MKNIKEFLKTLTINHYLIFFGLVSEMLIPIFIRNSWIVVFYPLAAFMMFKGAFEMYIKERRKNTHNEIKLSFVALIDAASRSNIIDYERLKKLDLKKKGIKEVDEELLQCINAKNMARVLHLSDYEYKKTFTQNTEEDVLDKKLKDLFFPEKE